MRNTSSPATLRAMVESMTGMDATRPLASPTSTVGRVDGSHAYSPSHIMEGPEAIGVTGDIENQRSGDSPFGSAAAEVIKKRQRQRERVRQESTHLMEVMAQGKLVSASSAATTALRSGNESGISIICVTLRR